MALSKQSQRLSPLPPVLSHGLVAVSTLGLLSFCCSASLFLYLTYRLIVWRTKAGPQAPTNQFLFLIYNLLFADIQQSLGFLLNISALQKDAIDVGSSDCWAQGWFISTGLANSVFILAIAVHTFMSVVRQYRMPSWAFYSWVCVCWLFVYVMAIIGPLMYKDTFYVRAAAWCWVNEDYQTERLWLHYMWVFVAMFSTFIIYIIIFIYVQRHSLRNAQALPSSSRNSTTQSLAHGATPMMLLYPFIYTLCTAPLAAGRIASMAGRDISLAYFCVAGSMIACNGWLDVLLYATTRRAIVFSEAPPSEETGLETFAFLGKGHEMGNVTTIQAASQAHGRSSSRTIRKELSRNESTENLYGMALGHIEIKESVKVTVEDFTSRSGSGSRSEPRRTPLTRTGSWDERNSVKSMLDH
ncbi:hypothetical protein BP6252_02451 [Coleophoma cylindrospora]|uniref:Glucose receptor Git3-like N-terminal domain-containing protein n=1 Tax=Coleophoma cylindrospora TaxID=1849047 RepID=A0A3D8SF91_9HELO|nr:hypothetical protein BP6252_02451 [Coleophoma cylindrospora]